MGEGWEDFFKFWGRSSVLFFVMIMVEGYESFSIFFRIITIIGLGLWILSPIIEEDLKNDKKKT
ncbi:hypothetical protein LCGC14_0439250 [marine sediment metagenome]|uniref:Uncharacterized protein n=1 Tax=marine sediment metagenome TaxID=412755 RepID=A0A0F9T421_9ZZZZ